MGRLPRRRRLERRAKYAKDPNLRDKRKGADPAKAFMCGECSSYIDVSCNRYSPNQKALLVRSKGKGNEKEE